MAVQLDKVFIPPHATLKAVLQTIDDNSLGIALVVDENNRLMGLVTDGDLRRAILNGNTLDSAVQKVMNANPVTASSSTPREQVISLMDSKIRHIPLLDNDGKVSDLVSFGELSKNIPWAVPYIGAAEEAELTHSLRTSWVTMGPKVQKLERNIADYVGVKHGIAVSNGTAALDVALKLLGIGPGDEVIVPALTYIATANAVLYQHATPVLADIDEATFNIDPKEVEKKITPRTKCVMAIDYGGQSSDYERLVEITNKQNIALIEDGAQSLGGQYRGRNLCSFGAISTVSFHAAKVITSVEGGMVLTNDQQFADMARIIRNQGEDPKNKYHHVVLGHNYRMTDLHAGIGLAQFQKLDDILKKRSLIADYYTRELSRLDVNIGLPRVKTGNKHAWFFYSVRVEARDQVVKYLSEKGVDTRIAWPLPIHQQPLYQKYFMNERYPVAEQVAGSILSLPLYYEMTEEELRYVVFHLKSVLKLFGKKHEVA